MAERDWAKDWEAYKKTTPGKWEVEGAGGVYMDGTRDGYNICVNGKRLNNPLFSYEDATFIATAHESWPVILKERARLEARVKELEQLVCDFQAAALLGIDPDGITPELVEHEITTLRLRVQELEAENAHLKAVIDAAKWVRETWVNNWEREIMEVGYGSAKRLDDALRAWAALEERIGHDKTP